MLILGGTGRLYGAVLGTLIFMFVHHWAAANDPFNWLFVIGALVLAIVSSFRDRPLGRDLVVFGAIGLSGEIRPVPQGQERLYEAVKHGFKRAIIPKANKPRQLPDGVEVIAVSTLAEALEAI